MSIGLCKNVSNTPQNSAVMVALQLMIGPLVSVSPLLSMFWQRTGIHLLATAIFSHVRLVYGDSTVTL